MELPHPAAGRAPAQLSITDITYKSAISVAGATSGIAVATFDQVPSGTKWMVDRLIVSLPGATGYAYVYDDPSMGQRSLLDGTTTGAFAPGDYPAGMLIDEGQQLVVQWQGVPVGSETFGIARVQLRSLLLTPGASA